MMIQVLCYCCDSHILNTDVARLDWPMSGAMFDAAYPGWYLRPGPLDLNYFCPVCQMFPFHHDPCVAGANAVGKNLNVRGPDGKPQVLSIKQILMGYGVPTYLSETGEMPIPAASREPATLSQGNDGKLGSQVSPSRVIPPEDDRAGANLPDKSAQSPGEKPAFPCPICGAKKRFHKKGCTAAAVPSPSVAEVRVSAPPDPIILSMEARVSSGPDIDDKPTIADLKELERDRERRASGRPEPELRPGEGYAPKAV